MTSKARLPLSDAALRLGFSSDSIAQVSNSSVGQSFANFCAQLDLSGDQQTIRSNGEFFQPGESPQLSLDEWRANLQLLCGLVRPDETLIETIFDRTRAADRASTSRGQLFGHVYPLAVAQAVQSFAQFRDMPEYAILAKGRNVSESLTSVTCELSSAPGLTWISSIEFRNWDDSWAIALYYPDAEEFRVSAFPTIIGFVTLKDFHISAGTLLAEEETFYASGSSIAYGDDLLAACWMRHGDDENESIGRLLLSLSEGTRASITSEYGSLTNPELYEDIRVVEMYGIDELEADDEHAFLEAVKVHGGISPSNGLRKIRAAIPPRSFRIGF